MGRSSVLNGVEDVHVLHTSTPRVRTVHYTCHRYLDALGRYFICGAGTVPTRTLPMLISQTRQFKQCRIAGQYSPPPHSLRRLRHGTDGSCVVRGQPSRVIGTQCGPGQCFNTFEWNCGHLVALEFFSLTAYQL